MKRPRRTPPRRVPADAEPPHLNLDLERDARCGFPEVIYGAGKSRAQILAAARGIYQSCERLLVTRIDAETGRWLARQLRGATYHESARALTKTRSAPAQHGHIVVFCAGTSDVPVAEEARVTAEILGNRVEAHYDVGVAGLHRLLKLRPTISAARVLIVVAGMDGALPSVVAGLTHRAVIGVPTSVGYGAALGGLSALTAMLSSCAAGLTVVNIDNGYGAGVAASRINQLETLGAQSQRTAGR
ncbi:MAG: nickel pincer cofactor biosynthesis protein LarB [Planctomycetota bacterium]